MQSRALNITRNVFAVVGILSLISFVLIAGADWASAHLGQKSVYQTAVSGDGFTKATVYQIDVGAMGATRTYVALSNIRTDGSKQGDVVTTFIRLDGEGNKINLNWKENRLLIIEYPANAEIEYSVSKTRGIVIQYVPIVRPLANS